MRHIGHVTMGGNVKIISDAIVNTTVINWVTPSTLANVPTEGTVNTRIQAVSSDLTPVTYAVTGGTLPQGLILDSTTGLLTGTAPATAQSVSITVTALSGSGVYNSRDFTFQITAHGPVWQTPAGTLGSGGSGAFFYATLSAPDSAGFPVAYHVSYGSLPTGLSLNTATGTISGYLPTISRNVTFNFSVTATNGYTSATESFGINVEVNPGVTWLTASGTLGSELGGLPYESAITATDVNNAPITYTVESGSLPLGVVLNTDGLFTGTLPVVTDDTVYEFVVQASNGSASELRGFTITALASLYSVDAYAPSTQVLIHMNGADQSSLFTDVMGHSVSNGGTVRVSDYYWVFDGGAGYFPGAQGGDLAVSYDSSPLASSDFTVEFWVQFQTLPTTRQPLFAFGQTSFYYDGSGNLVFAYLDSGNQPQTISVPWVVNPYQWFAIAVVRSGNQITVFQNGAVIGTGGLTSGQLNGFTGLMIGSDGTNYLNGYMDEFRLSTAARYGSAGYSTQVRPWPGVPLWQTASPLPSGIAATNYSTTVSATDPMGLGLFYASEGSMPGGLTINPQTGVISGLLPNDTIDTNELVPLQVSDGYNAIPKTFQLPVVPYVAPQIPGETNGQLILPNTVGLTTLNYTIPSKVQAPLVPTFAVIAGALPSWLTLDATTGLLSGTAPDVATETNYSFTVAVGDGYSTAAADVTVPVVVNEPPVWQTPPGLLVSDDALTSVSGVAVVATDVNQLAVSYEIASGSLPASVTMGTNGVLSGTLPSVPANETFTFAVTASNGYKTSSETFEIDILYVDAPIWNTAPGSLGSGLANEPFSATVSAYDPQGRTVSYSVVSGSFPAGLSLDAQSGAITGTLSPVSATEVMDFVLGASNGTYTADESFSITVDVNHAITFQTADHSVLAVTPSGHAVATAVAASTSDTASVVYSAGSLPSFLTLDASTGQIHGTAPVVPANSTTTPEITSFPFTVTATNGTDTAIIDVAVDVENLLPIWHTAAGNIGSYYGSVSFAFSATQTYGLPLTFSLAPGSSLPSGVTLDSHGNLSGTTPTVVTNTSYPFTVDVTDGLNVVSETFYFVVVGTSEIAADTPVWNTSGSLAPAVADVGYSYVLSATDPNGLALTYVVSAGTLPHALTLSSAGDISGTPDKQPALTDETFDFTVTVSNGNQDATRSFSIFVQHNDGIAWVTGPSLGGTPSLIDISIPLVADSYNTTAPSYTLASGTLPSGVTLAQDTGILSGTLPLVTVDTNYTFAVTATNGINSTTQSFTLTDLAPIPVWNTASGSLGSAVAGSEVSVTLSATSPVGRALTYKVISGALPSGLTLSGTGQITGILSDVLQTTTSNFTVAAVDSTNLSASRSFSFTTQYNSAMSWNAPSGRIGIVEGGSSYENTTISATGNAGAITYTVSSGALPVGVTMDPATGSLTGSIPPVTVDTTYNFTVNAAEAGNTSIFRAFSLTAYQTSLATDTYSESVVLLMHFDGDNQSQATPVDVMQHTVDRVVAQGAQHTLGPVTSSVRTYFGNTSLYLDGVSGLIVPYEPEFDFTTTDFTVEFQVNFKTIPQAGLTLFAAQSFTANYNGSALIFSYIDASQTGQTQAFQWVAAPDRWYSLALVRSSGNLYFFVNGVQVGNAANVGSFGVPMQSSGNSSYELYFPLGIGCNASNSSGDAGGFINAYFDELRVTRAARYTTSYPVAAHPFPDLPAFTEKEGSLGTYVGGLSYDMLLHATNPYNGTLTYAVASGTLPSGITLLQTGEITGTPTNPPQNTNYPFVLSVSDGYNTTVQSYSLYVENNLPPVWQTAAGVILTALSGYFISTRVVATSPQNDTLTYSLTYGALPQGVTLNSSTGVISGTLPLTQTNTTYPFTITVFDGLNSVARSFSITGQANLPPVWNTAAGSLGNIEGGVAYKTTVSATDPENQTVTYSVSTGALPQGLSLDPQTGVISGTPVNPPGANQTSNFTLTASNGFDSSSISCSFTVLYNKPPVWQTAANLGSVIGETQVSLTVVATDPEGQPVTYALETGSTLPQGLALDATTGILSGLIFSPNSNVTESFTLTAYDGVTYVPKTFSLTVDYHEGIVWQTASGVLYTGLSGTPINPPIYVTATQGQGLPVTYSVVGGALPSYVNLDSATGEISGTPPAIETNTQYQFTIEATDGYRTANQTFAIEENANLPPIWQTAAGSLGSVQDGIPASFQLTATDPENQTVTYAITAGTLPTGLTLNDQTGLISGTPNTVLTGTDTFTVGASDGVNLSTRTFSLDIKAVQAPVWVTAAGSLGSFKAGKPITPIQLDATDPQGLPLTYSLSDLLNGGGATSSLPAGLSLSSSGQITGSPANPGNTKTISFTVYVSDGYAEAAQTFSITVQAETNYYDPYSDNVRALMDFEGAPGSFDFVDYAGHPVTLYENSHVRSNISDGQVAFGKTSGLIQGGSSVYLTPFGSEFDLNEDDFCIEISVFWQPREANFTVYACGVANAWNMQISQTGWTFATASSSPSFTLPAGSLPYNEWAHLAVARRGNYLSFYLNGKMLYRIWWIVQIPPGTGRLAIGAGNATQNAINDGPLFFDNFRLTIGNARYDGDYVPSQIVAIPEWTTAAGVIGNGVAGSPLNVQLEATSAYGQNISYSLTAGTLPSGIVLDPNTGAISGTLPSVTADKVYPFTVTATDGYGNARSRDFSIFAKAIPAADPNASNVVALFHFDKPTSTGTSAATASDSFGNVVANASSANIVQSEEFTIAGEGMLYLYGNGASATISVPTLSSAVTIDAQVYFMSPEPAQIFSVNDSSYTLGVIYDGVNLMLVTLGASGSATVASGPYTIATGAPTLISAEYSGGTASLYANGALIASGTGSFPTAATQITLGGSSQQYDGSVTGEWYSNLPPVPTVGQAPTGTPIAKTVATNINYENGYSWAGATAFPSGAASAYFSGTVVVPTTGTYVVGLNSDDGSTLVINGTAYFGLYGQGQSANGASLGYTNSVSLVFTAGEVLNIELYYANTGGAGGIQFIWTPPGGSAELVPFMTGNVTTVSPNAVALSQDANVYPSAAWLAAAPFVFTGNWYNGDSSDWYPHLETTSFGTPVATTKSWALDFYDATQGTAQTALSLPTPSGVNANFYYAHFTGSVIAPTTGTYLVNIVVDDGADLYVNGVRLIEYINNNITYTAGTTTGTFYAVAGDILDFDVRWQQSTSASELLVEWMIPGSTAYTPISTIDHLGFVDEVRVTNGVARYSANFTSTTAAFPDNPTWESPAYLGAFGLGGSVSIVLSAACTDQQPLSYLVVGGNLPGGLTLSQAGVIIGTMTGSTSDIVTTFTVRATNTVTKTFSQKTFTIETLATETTDPFADSVVLQMPLDQTFDDRLGHSVFASPSSAIVASPALNGVGSLSIAANTAVTVLNRGDLNMTGDFTLEWSMYIPIATANGHVLTVMKMDNSFAIDLGSINATNYTMWVYGAGGPTDVTALTISNSALVTPSTWYQYALVRSGTTLSLYVNGTLVSSATTNSSYGRPRHYEPLVISYPGTATYQSGVSVTDHPAFNVAAIRLTQAARYTGNYTVTNGDFPEMPKLSFDDVNGTVIASEHLIGRWTFDDGTANDVSGNGLNGTFVSNAKTTAIPGRPGRALDLTGGGYVQIPAPVHAPPMQQPYTITAWICLLNPNAEYSCILGWGGDGGNGLSALMAYSASALIGPYDWWYGDDIFTASLGKSPTDGRWMHMAVTFDGTNRTTYLDGELWIAGTAPPRTHAVSYHQAMRIGSDPGNVGYEPDGYLDDVRLYDVALTPRQIKMIYTGENAATAGQSISAKMSAVSPYSTALTYSLNVVDDVLAQEPADHLVGWWTFDDGTANDSSGNGNNGTLTNGATITAVPGWSGKVLSLTAAKDQSVAIPVNRNIPVGNQSYTISAWVSPTTSAGPYAVIVGWGGSSTNTANVVRLEPSGTNFAIRSQWWADDLVSPATSGPIGANNWFHIVATCTSGYRAIYVNGVLAATDQPGAVHTLTVTGDLQIGAYPQDGSTQPFDGFIDDVRIYDIGLSGPQVQSLYQSTLNGNLPANAGTAIPSVTIDSAGLISGAMSSPASPYEYIFEVSVGDGKNTTTAAIPFLADLTVPTWDYAISTNSPFIYGVGGGSVKAYLTATSPTGDAITYSVAAGSTLPGSLTLDATTGIVSGDLPTVASDSVFSVTFEASVNGASSSITLDIQVLAAIPADPSPNTVFLLHCDGANNDQVGTDVTGIPVTPFNGRVLLSTAQARFGTSSLYFDPYGVSSAVLMPGDMYLGGNDFTIEFWNYFTVAPGSITMLAVWDASNSDWFAIQTSSGSYFLNLTGLGNGSIGGTVPVKLNTWQHVAVCRQGTTATLYVDGVNAGSASVSGSFQAQASADANLLLTLGCVTSGGSATNNLTNAYLDEIRITNGTARYTANFTPPTLPFLPPMVWNTIHSNLTYYGGEQIALNVTTANNGSASYALISGTLPPGITVEAGGVGGILTNPGQDGATYAFEIEASDGVNTATRQFTITTMIGVAPTWLMPSGDIYTGTQNEPVSFSMSSENVLYYLGNPGSGNGLMANSNAFNIGTGDLTVETWYSNWSSGTSALVFMNSDAFGGGTASNWMWYIQLDGATITVSYGNGSTVLTGTIPSYSATAWYHIAVVRASGTKTLYVDGVALTSASDVVDIAATYFDIGWGVAADLAGVHVCNSAIYTANFTPAWMPQPGANTILLTAVGPQFIDYSGNNTPVTVVGSPQVGRITRGLSTSYTVSSGSFPATLTLDSYGNVTGALPAVAQDTAFTFTVEANNGAGVTSQTMTITALATAPSDPDFANVLMLMDFDGANNGFDFVDLAGEDVVPPHVTGGGNEVLANSRYLRRDGSASLVTGPSVANLMVFPTSRPMDLTTSGYTIECSFAFDTQAESYDWAINYLNAWGFQYQVPTSSNSFKGQIYVQYSNTAGTLVQLYGPVAPLSPNTWHDIAFTWDGTNDYLFVDGKLILTSPQTLGIRLESTGLRIGENATRVGRMFISGVRITSTVCRYTSDYTPRPFGQSFPRQ